MLVLIRQNVRPEVHVHALDDVSGLKLKQRILVRHRHELQVALAALVRHAREIRIALLAVLANDLRVVVLVGGEEVLGVGVGVDENHAERVVHVGVRGTLRHEVLEEGREHLQAVALAHLLDEGTDGQGERTDRMRFLRKSSLHS